MSHITNVQDPNFPLIQLPAQFRAQRHTMVDRQAGIGETIEVFRAQGPGCVRHIWIVPNPISDTRFTPDYIDNSNTNAIVKIYVDDDPRPLVNMDLKRLCGVLLDQSPYRVDNAGFAVLPRKMGSVHGDCFNIYLPIPFAKSCRITMEPLMDQCIRIMADWQQFPEGSDITPYRLHAVYRSEYPASHHSSFLMADLSGKGFVAGIVKGIRQREHTDMIYHTGGQVWMIDGESDPHVMRGINEEDDFAFGWGYHEVMTRWIGCPYHRYATRTDQDGVIYRFFGLNPVTFDSSLLLRCGSRADDTETVVYYYRVPESQAPPVTSPKTWEMAGAFGCADHEEFLQPEIPEQIAAPWLGQFKDDEVEFSVHSAKSEHTWIDFSTYCRTGSQGQLDRSAYARTTIESEDERSIQIRLGFDDWLSVWLNGENLGTFRHDHGFASINVPARLKKGDNKLMVKLSNLENVTHGCWAMSCVLESTD
ncbi:MAG: DUF2961 domain-containing protein [Candidatus Poribacteria bacterium]|nr:DUF2961 domain-containing protein [Candidatus Poribacteria bacterium]